jgi:hypothetical protein
MEECIPWVLYSKLLERKADHSTPKNKYASSCTSAPSHIFTVLCARGTLPGYLLETSLSVFLSDLSLATAAV